jgi:hypothetical protein
VLGTPTLLILAALADHPYVLVGLDLPSPRWPWRRWPWNVATAMSSAGAHTRTGSPLRDAAPAGP